MNKTLKSVLLILCFFVGVKSQAQSPTDTLKATHVKWKLTRDPATLARALTEGKTTDKEKFEALFTWVATNIRYNYRRYDSGKSNSMSTPIKRTLRRRSGICTDQAQLMDTLCYEAGIQSAMVTGYAKEVIFDVNDSIYVDNHAWNAVKLQGYWYVYDVTWSSGGRVYQFTKQGQWRRNWIEKLLKKRKPETIYIDRGGQKKDKFCGIPDSSFTEKYEIMCMPFIPRILVNILMYFPFKVKEKESFVMNTDYYLTDPDVFALDHFPSDPIWSLTTRLSNVSEYAADSAYYYKTKATYQNMNRRGQFCLTCEDALYMEPIPKQKYLIKQSKKNNPNNHLLPANANFRLAQLYFEKVVEEEDSLTKMAFIDTTFSFIDSSRRELSSTRKAGSLEARFQGKKNRAKRNEHLRENKIHMNRARKAWKATNKRHIKIKSLIPKSRTYDRRNKKDVRKLRQTVFMTLKSKSLNEKRVESLSRKFQASNAKSDSITRLISNLEDSLLLHTKSLWKNLLDELDILSPLLFSFEEDNWLRGANSLDNFDREIRELRKTIVEKEDIFHSTVENRILLLADKTYAEYMLLNRQIKKRNLLNKQAGKTLKTLLDGGAISRDSIENFFKEKEEIMVNDACWSVDNAQLFKSLDWNFKHFYNQSRYVFRLISNNNHVERSRYSGISKHILRNKKRLNHAVQGNYRLNRNLKKMVYLHRGKYLKQLKKKRK